MRACNAACLAFALTACVQRAAVPDPSAPTIDADAEAASTLTPVEADAVAHDARREQAAYALHRQRWLLAEDLYTAILADEPDAVDVLVNRSIARVGLLAAGGARDDAERALQLAPDDEAVRLHAATLAVWTGDAARALDITNDLRSDTARLIRASATALLGDELGARTAYRGLTESTDPDVAWRAWCGLGAAGGPLDAWQRAVELAPTQPLALLGLARATEAANGWDAAEPLYREYLRFASSAAPERAAIEDRLRSAR